MTAAIPTEPTAPPSHSPDPLVNRFHFITIIVQRAQQLQAGARPRVDPVGHKPARIAMIEAAAGMVSWQIVEKE